MSTNDTLPSTLCDQYIIWPMTEACSGNGYCSSEGICICNDGWSGRGEMIDRTGIDCNVNQTGIIIIHVIGIIIACIAMSMAIRTNWRALRARRIRPAADSHVDISRGDSHAPARAAALPVVPPKLARQPSKWVMVASACLCPRWIRLLISDPASVNALFINSIGISAIVYHIQRLATTESEIYRQWGTSIMMFWALTSFWCGTSIYAWNLVKQSTLAISHSRGTAGATASLERMRTFLYGSAIIGSAGAVGCLWNRAATSVEDQETSMITFYIVIGVAGKLNCFFFLCVATN
jgi:hypothetical protein